MSKLVFNRDGGKTDQYGTHLVRQRLFTGEVAEGCQVVANASPNMDIRVQAGTMRIPTGTAPANYWYEAGIDTASPGEAVTISTANPSNPRRDFIVAYIDTAVTPSTGVTNNSNSMLKLAAVAGTPAASPSDPSAGQITTAIGASNPYIILARIAVGTGVTQITNSDITDLRQMMGVNRANADAITTDMVADSAITPEKMLGIDMFGLAAAHNGTAPAAGSGQFYIQCGSTVGTVTSNALDITFPVPFPNGLMMVVATNGDSVGVNPITIGSGSTNKNGFRAQSAANGATRVNWIAIGF